MSRIPCLQHQWQWRVELIRLSNLHTQRSEPCVLIGPENGGSNSLRNVGYPLLFSHGGGRITVLSTQWPWQWQIQNKNDFSVLLKHNNCVEFMSLLRSSAEATKLRRLVHIAAHAWRHCLPTHCRADSWQLTKMLKSTTVEIVPRHARITTDPQLPLEECQQNKYTECHRRNGPNFGRVFLMLKYTDITQNTYIQSWTLTEIMAREVWNFDSCYTLTDCQIHIETGRNMWFL